MAAGRPGHQALPRAPTGHTRHGGMADAPSRCCQHQPTLPMAEGTLDLTPFLRLNISKQTVKTIPILEALKFIFKSLDGTSINPKLLANTKSPYMQWRQAAAQVCK